MNSKKSIALFCTLLLLGSAWAAWENITPKNIQQAEKIGNPTFKLSFAPDFVACDIPRRFMIELEFPQGYIPTEVSSGNAVRLVGRRDLEQKLGKTPARKLRRLYFETVSPADPVRIQIQSPGGKIVIPVTVWGYEDLRQTRKINGMTFPRRLPLGGTLPYVKERQVFPRDPAVRIADPIRFTGLVTKRIHYNEPIKAHDYTMQEIWDFAPDTSFTVRKPFPGPPDPRHGDKIYQASGDPFYPYKIIPPLPGKPGKYLLISPVDGKTVPDNDWGTNDFSGEYVDDGINGAEFNGIRHYYVGVIAVMRSLMLHDLVAQTADLYEKTGDTHYADLTLAGLCRIAVEHNMIATLAQNRLSHYNFKSRKLVESVPFDFLGNTGFFIDGIWTTAQVQRAALAYDKIFPAINDQAPVIEFMQRKNFPVRSATELKRFIEGNLFLTYLQAQADGICRSNFPHSQRTYGTIARVLDYPDTRFVDKLYKDGLGNKMFLGMFWRDSVKDESPGGYNGRGLSIFHELFSLVDGMVAAHPELYDRSRYPSLTRNRRFLAGALSQLKHPTTPYTQITIGNASKLNTFKSAKRYSRRYTGDETPEYFETIYRDFPAPELAWALLHTQGYRPRTNPTKAELTAMAAKLPPGWRCHADVITGPGISLLRGGDGDAERTVYSHYGWFYHGQDTTMGLYFDAMNSRLVTGQGYPAKLDAWYFNWMGNNTGRYFPAMKSQGTAPRRWSAAEGDLFGYNEYAVTCGSVQAMRNRGIVVATDLKAPQLNRSVFTVSPNHSQSRQQVLVNVGPEQFYFADFYTMRGGKEHWRSFGSLDGPVSVTGLELQKQSTGTLAGPNVSYNDAKWIKENGGEGSVLGFTRIRDVERAKTSDASPFEAVWQLNDSNNAFLRLICVAPGNGEVAFGNASDHNKIYPMVRRMLFWHHQPATGKNSRVLNLIEAGRGAELIDKVERLELAGTADADAVACRVRLATGENDYLILADRPGEYRVQLPEGVLELNGSAGVVRVRDGRSSLHLIHGSRLAYGDQELKQPAAVLTGKIVAVDHNAWGMTITPAVDDPAALAGKFINVNRNGARFTLQILKAENNDAGTRLLVDCPSLADHYIVTGHADGTLQVLPKESRASITDMQYRLAGMELFGKSGKLYICDIRIPPGDKLWLLSRDAGTLDAATLQQEFPVGTDVEFYDYTPGMSVEIPLSQTIGKGK